MRFSSVDMAEKEILRPAGPRIVVISIPPGMSYAASLSCNEQHIWVTAALIIRQPKRTLANPSPAVRASTHEACVEAQFWVETCWLRGKNIGQRFGTPNVLVNSQYISAQPSSANR
jgi:hypothetical protein